MRILLLTQIIPYPPDAGPKVKTWHVLRYLVGQGHQVILASFVRPEEEPFVPEVQKVCKQVYTVPIRRSRLADIGYWLKSNLTGRPFLVERDDLSEMRNVVNQIIQSEQIEVIHADQLTMAQFAMQPDKNQPWPTTIFDAHNAVWTIVNRTQESTNWLLKPVLALEAKRVFRHEGEILTRFDHILAVSEPDKIALLQTKTKDGFEKSLASKISVIPIAVDTEELKPIQRKKGSKNIFTMGTLHYPPNADGIRWFSKNIFPLIQKRLPEVSLTITGKNPPSDFIQMAEQNPEAIRVTGYVPDLTPYFEEAAMLVVPVRAGGGIRVRILEAFARAIPVVTTSVGLEGIEAQPGVDVLVEDDEKSFANAVVDLINNPKLQDQLAQNGRKVAEKRYDWQIILRELDHIYNHVH